MRKRGQRGRDTGRIAPPTLSRPPAVYFPLTVVYIFASPRLTRVLFVLVLFSFSSYDNNMTVMMTR